MLSKPDQRTLAALADMAQSAAWTEIEKWLLAAREACVQASLNRDPAASRQAQGAFQAIDAFIDITQKARDLGRR